MPLEETRVTAQQYDIKVVQRLPLGVVTLNHNPGLRQTPDEIHHRDRAPSKNPSSRRTKREARPRESEIFAFSGWKTSPWQLPVLRKNFVPLQSYNKPAPLPNLFKTSVSCEYLAIFTVFTALQGRNKASSVTSGATIPLLRDNDASRKKCQRAATISVQITICHIEVSQRKAKQKKNCLPLGTILSLRCVRDLTNWP